MKTSATTGSTMAAISLLRSAGVFPSNRAMTFKLAHAVAYLRQKFRRETFTHFVARLSLRRGARAPEVCCHVESKADERAARRRRRLRAGRSQRGFRVRGRRW